MKKLRLLLLVLAFCLLTGCASGRDDDDDDDEPRARKKNSKKTEQVSDDDLEKAEELINGIQDMFKNASDQYINMGMKLDMKAVIDASALGGDEGMTMNMVISFDATIESDKDTNHTYGDTHAELFGMNVDQKMDTYKELIDGDMYQVYEYSSDNDAWTTYKEDKDDDSDMSDSFKSFDASTFKDLKLEKDGDTYVVTGTLSLSDLAGSMDMMGSFGLGGGDEDALKDCYYEVSMTFDQKSQDLQKMAFSVKNMNLEGTDVKKYTIELEVNEIGGSKEVSVPAEVISAAGESDDSWDFGSDDWDFDDTNSDDMTEPLEFDTTGTYTEPLEFDTTGTYNAQTFMAKINSLTGGSNDDWYVYNSDYGYTKISYSLRADDYSWYLYLDFSIYDPDNEGAFTAESDYESMGGTYYKDYLTKNAPDGVKVNGASKDNCALWYMDGGNYDTYYIAIDGNTLIKASGDISSFGDNADPAASFTEMSKKLEALVKELGLPY